VVYGPVAQFCKLCFVYVDTNTQLRKLSYGILLLGDD
jgi:hypothetical protein